MLFPSNLTFKVSPWSGSSHRISYSVESSVGSGSVPQYWFETSTIAPESYSPNEVLLNILTELITVEPFSNSAYHHGSVVPLDYVWLNVLNEESIAFPAI